MLIPDRSAYVTRDEAAAMLGVDYETIRRASRKGILAEYKFPGCRPLLIKRSDLQAFAAPTRHVPKS